MSTSRRISVHFSMFVNTPHPPNHSRPDCVFRVYIWGCLPFPPPRQVLYFCTAVSSAKVVDFDAYDTARKRRGGIGYVGGLPDDEVDFPLHRERVLEELRGVFVQ